MASDDYMPGQVRLRQNTVDHDGFNAKQRREAKRDILFGRAEAPLPAKPTAGQIIAAAMRDRRTSTNG